MKKERKKRGRKPKNEKNVKNVKKALPKKRGRKPKGGKIIKANFLLNDEKQPAISPNIILHLKCSSIDLRKKQRSISELNYSPNISNIESFSLVDHKEYELYNYANKVEPRKIKKAEKECEEVSTQKEIGEKLKKLQKILHTNDIAGKKSDCFWCTCPFDNPPIYIPARHRGENIECYGCFCSPECAVAYLCKENIASSTRWERYSLLNNIYAKIFDFKKNIKPAPDPFYTLDKYYGNLTIQEYRQLLGNSHILLIVDKPLTKILPELHEENFDLRPNYKSIHNNTPNSNLNKLSLRRKHPVDSKKNILSANFNFG